MSRQPPPNDCCALMAPEAQMERAMPLLGVRPIWAWRGWCRSAVRAIGIKQHSARLQLAVPLSLLLRQLCLPPRGAWALTSPGLPWAGPGDLTTHHATDCTSCLDSDLYATRAAVGHGTQPGSMGRQPVAGAVRLCSVRYACRCRPWDPTGFFGPSAGRGSYVTTHLGTAGRGTKKPPRIHRHGPGAPPPELQDLGATT